MKKYLIIGAVLFLWVVFSVYLCLSQTKEKTILDNVLTLELSFGDKNLPSEYLLAVPYAFVIANNNDIIIFDESRLKIYDTQGKPKQIVGRPGQGPGEFSEIAVPFYSEDGYLTVENIITPSIQSVSYNLFGPDYKLIERKQTQFTEAYQKLQNEFRCNRLSYSSIYTFAEGKQIIRCSGTYYSERNTDSSFTAIAFFTGKETKIIYSQKRYPNDFDASEAGQLQIDFLSNHRIAYTNPPKGKTFENNVWYYCIHLYNLDTDKTQEIKYPYTPLAIPDSLLNLKIDKDAPPRYEQFARDYVEQLRKLKYYAPVQFLIADGGYLFVFTFLKKNSQFAADVFDVNKNNYICSIYLPFRSSTLDVIKNSYFYRKTKSKEGYYVIEKYRIDPRVYGK